MAADIEKFRLPRYEEIPDVGLYLEQTVKYINGYLEPLGCMSITGSMISNYVKKKYVERPVKKQYYPNQIMYLIFIAIVKQALAMDQIALLFAMQEEEHTPEEAYEYFCEELEQMLRYVFGMSSEIEADSSGLSEVQVILRNAIIAVSHIIYLNDKLPIAEKKK